MSLEVSIKHKSLDLGFSLCGITRPTVPTHWNTFQAWLAQGRHGTMQYLEDAWRFDPRRVLPECRSILVLAAEYAHPGQQQVIEDSKSAGSIASYAWGRDYHRVLAEKMEELVRFMEQETGDPFPYKCCTDSAPILERDLAQQAGLGWIGRNTCLIHPELGSFFFLAEVLVGIALDPDAPFTADRCGNCSNCITACPTQCILADRTLDARRCISYLTIENRGDIPESLRPALENRVFGCDLCQQVCPWNRKAPGSHDPEFDASKEIQNLNLSREMGLSSKEFKQKFTDSPILRSKYRGYLRNVAVALGNLGDLNALPVLEEASQQDDILIREHAAWAASQIRKKAVVL
jgi:epoxyqueuosine reductase